MIRSDLKKNSANQPFRANYRNFNLELINIEGGAQRGEKGGL